MEEREGEDRIESYDALGPDGKKVRVTRNIETGEIPRRLTYPAPHCLQIHPFGGAS